MSSGAISVLVLLACSAPAHFSRCDLTASTVHPQAAPVATSSGLGTADVPADALDPYAPFRYAGDGVEHAALELPQESRGTPAAETLAGVAIVLFAGALFCMGMSARSTRRAAKQRLARRPEGS